jgi:hypothetical protein
MPFDRTQVTHDVLCDRCGERHVDDSIPEAINTPLCGFCREKDCLDAARDYDMISGLQYAVAVEDLKRRREAARD